MYFRSAQRLDPAPFEWSRVATVIAVVICCLPISFLPFSSVAVEVAVKLATFSIALAALWPLGVIGPMEREFLRGLVSGPRRPPKS